MSKKITENKDTTINIRISSNDYRLFKISAKSIGMTPSKLIQTYIATSINPLKVKVANGEINLEDLEKALEI